MSKKHLIKSAGQLVPHLHEGQQLMTNGLKKDTSRFSTGSSHSTKDITKGVKRAKSRAVQNFNNRVNADKKVLAMGKQYHKAKYQIEINERSTVEDPEAFLQAKERSDFYRERREKQKQLKGR